EQVLPSLIEASRDSDVRYAASEALLEVVKAAPAHAEQVLPSLIEASRDEDEDVRRAAISALGEVVKAAPEHAEQVLPSLLEASRDSDYWVRSAASEALGEVVKAAPQNAEKVLPSLIEASRDDNDPYGEVRRAASSALGEISLQQLIETYWATQNQALIPIIVPLIATRLYHTPLMVRTIPNSEEQQLILYPTAGKPVVTWKKPNQEVQRFVQQIKSAAKLRN
ncbi:MAG: HEAT repeat domain-containing protein, partial [Cytophagales bacterium]|nr:HEAT repeat domain-containing protein [Cytophagales bacterium]